MTLLVAINFQCIVNSSSAPWFHESTKIIGLVVYQQEIGDRKIKVNVTEKPLQTVDMSLLQADDSEFTDSPYKVYAVSYTHLTLPMKRIV